MTLDDPPIAPIPITDPREAMSWLTLVRSHVASGFNAARAGLGRDAKAAEARKEIDRCERNALRLILAAQKALPAGTMPVNWGSSASPASPAPRPYRRRR